MVAIVRRMREGGVKREIYLVASKMIWAAKKDISRRNMQKKMDDRLKRL
jgi:aryl-alcohol dehydrogenase-like predicted oxidoreductase